MRCKAFDELGHWYKDSECIYNVMRNIIIGRDIDPAVVEKQCDEIKDLFKKADTNQSKVKLSDIVEVVGEKKEIDQSDTANTDKARKSYFR